MLAPREFVNRLCHGLTAAGRRSWRYGMAAALAATLVGFAPAASAVEANAPQNAPAVTQPAPPQGQAAMPGKPKLTRHERWQFDRYLDAHPKLAKQLEHDPALANNPQFLAKQTGFQKFLNHHPQIMAQLKEDPHAFMKHYAWYQKHERSHRMHKKA
jgi:hypothetical protein